MATTKKNVLQPLNTGQYVALGVITLGFGFLRWARLQGNLRTSNRLAALENKVFNG